jgi:cytoskeleton protein RodZ
VLALAIWWVLSGSHTVVSSSAAQQDAVAANAQPSPATAPAVQASTLPVVNTTSAISPAAAQTPTGTAAVTAAVPPPAEERTPARQTKLRLELTSESWVEVYDSRGARLFYDVASAGSVQSFEGRPPLRVVLGNAAAVAVQVDGQSRDPRHAVDGEGAFRRESIRPRPSSLTPCRALCSRSPAMKDVLPPRSCVVTPSNARRLPGAAA